MEDAKKQRKRLRKERRVTVRLNDELFVATEDRAYQEAKTISGVILEALIKHLDFKMPPRK